MKTFTLTPIELEAIARNHDRVRALPDTHQTRELITEDLCLVGQTIRPQSARVVVQTVPQLELFAP